MYEHILVTDEGPFRVITMNRPAKRNSLTLGHLRELREAVSAAGADAQVTGIIIAANGPAFSAGHDFHEMQGMDQAEAEDLFNFCSDFMQLISSVPQPVIAQVDAIATAAGCQLMASCDLVVAADTAHFQTPGGKGAIFCSTPAVALSRNIGRKRAMEMLLTGDPIDAATALDWGLINRAVPADQVANVTRELLGRATRGSRSSTSVGKRATYAQMNLPTESAYPLASQAMADETQTRDGQEAMAAFIEKRRAEF
jgi:enoyl-CoA hydratase/carnithine racemase